MKRACKKVRKNLVAFLNHQLEEKKAKEIEQHLDACSLCKKEEEELRLTWNLLGRLPVDKDFPDILNGVLERIDRESEKASFFQHLVEKITLIPAPAFSLLIFLLAIPPGTFLGKNLYFALGGSYQTSLRGAQNLYFEELPLDIFNDFPGQSLGNVYVNLISESSEEE